MTDGQRPRLVLLNGPPGIGKTTLAGRYVRDRPLALALDIDTLRRALGQWEAHQESAGQLARRMALAMAGTHLAAGHDVVVPQYVARSDFLDALADRAGVLSLVPTRAGVAPGRADQTVTCCSRAHAATASATAAATRRSRGLGTM